MTVSRRKLADRSSPRGPLIAIVGCDGSGKSTVSKAMTEFAMRFGRVEAVHLGKQSGNVGRALARLPLAGGWLDRVIQKKSGKVHGEKSRGNPGLVAAIVVYGFVLRRRFRFQRMLERWGERTIIIADRFPQVDIPGAADGPELWPDDKRASTLVRWLARMERRQFAWMTGYRPDLVIRLNVDLGTALSRKPDHRIEALRRKIEATPCFTFGGAPIVDVDSTLALPEVLDQARVALARVLAGSGYGDAGPIPSERIKPVARAQLSSSTSPSSSSVLVP